MGAYPTDARGAASARTRELESENDRMELRRRAFDALARNRNGEVLEVIAFSACPSARQLDRLNVYVYSRYGTWWQRWVVAPLLRLRAWVPGIRASASQADEPGVGIDTR